MGVDGVRPVGPTYTPQALRQPSPAPQTQNPPPKPAPHEAPK